MLFFGGNRSVTVSDDVWGGWLCVVQEGARNLMRCMTVGGCRWGAVAKFVGKLWQ